MTPQDLTDILNAALEPYRKAITDMDGVVCNLIDKQDAIDPDRLAAVLNRQAISAEQEFDSAAKEISIYLGGLL